MVQALSSAGETKQGSHRTERARELRQHLGHLDALRGIAVLGVILIHTGQAFGSYFYEYLNNPGMRGVQLFFVVSAFTLMLSTERRSSEPLPTTSFFLRRYFRLAPLYYPFIFLAYFTAPELHAVGWLHTLPAFLFLHDFSPTYYYAGTYGGWSLGVEATFYLCFPYLARRIRDLRSSVLWFIVVTVISSGIWMSGVVLHRAQWGYWSYYSWIVEMPVFLMGFIAYFLWRDHLSAVASTPGAKWTSAALLLLTAMILIDIVPIHPWKTLFSSVFCVTLLLAVSLYQWPLLVNRVTIFLGRVSYSMYLIHGALIWSVIPVLKQHFPAMEAHRPKPLWTVGAYIVVVLTSAVLAWGTWYWIEEPGIRLGRRVIRALQGRAPSPEPLHVPARAVVGTGSSPDAQF